ncbi:MFS transporter [Pectobacteriaceae bacterium CE70]|nr:MFS transporter [Pectobacteriaceae bacterium C52]WJV68334.1 MFS transporter [Pectobacteriaceae bacterium CE70]WJY12264.1 MFS transporter [Pectobacteriaceae bacterium C80]
MHNLHRVSLVIAICLGTFMASLDISIVNVALPTMLKSLKTSMSGLQWVVDAYALCLSALILSSGPLGDRFGRKRIWLGGIVLFTLGSIICAFAGSLAGLLIGRVIQGIAGAAVIPGALSLLTHAFPEEQQRIRVIGIWSSVNALSLVVGPILGGILVHSSGWPSIFLINIPIGIIAFLLGAWGLIESSHPEHAALDPIGQTLSILWLGLLTFGLISAGQYGWHNPLASWPLSGALVLFALFIWVETKVSRPLVPLILFRKTDFTGYNLASAVLGFSSYSSVFFVSLFLQQAQGWSPIETGWRMAPEFIAMAIMASSFGRLSARFSVNSLAIAGYGLVGIGLLLLAQLQADSHYLNTAIFLAVLGMGMGLGMPATSALVMRSVPAQRSGMASALMNALRQTGMTLGIALLGTLMSLRAVKQLSERLNDNHIPQSFDIAQSAIVDHRLIGDLTLPPFTLAKMTSDAFASGFSIAMLWAGAVSLVMTVWLLVMLHPHFRHSSIQHPIMVSKSQD